MSPRDRTIEDRLRELHDRATAANRSRVSADVHEGMTTIFGDALAEIERLKKLLEEKCTRS